MNNHLGSNNREVINGMEKACFSNDEISSTLSLLREVWPEGNFTKEYLEWLYRDNPLGAAEAYNFYVDNKVIAHYAAIPIEATIDEEPVKGLLSLNTAVSPLHRSKNYFKLLANHTYESALSNGYSFVIGVANAKSTLLFKRLLGFQVVCPLVVKIGVGKVIKKTFQNNLQYKRVWKRDTLSWRLKCPKGRYLISKRRGYVTIQANTGKYGIWATMLEGDEKNLPLPNDKGPGFLRLNPFRIWIGLDASCDWSKSLYVTLPEKLRPSPLNLIFKDLKREGITLDQERVSFSLLDFDAY